MKGILTTGPCSRKISYIALGMLPLKKSRCRRMSTILSCGIGLVSREGRVFGLMELSFTALETDRPIRSSLAMVSIRPSFSSSSSGARSSLNPFHECIKATKMASRGSGTVSFKMMSRILALASWRIVLSDVG